MTELFDVSVARPVLGLREYRFKDLADSLAKSAAVVPPSSVRSP